MAAYVKSKLIAARESLTPALRTSAFLSRGVLTPEEFVAAGDELVFRCPTWCWEGGSGEVKERGHLPPDKQYLVTRNVPCSMRVESMETAIIGETEVGVEGGKDDWLMSHVDANPDPSDDAMVDDGGIDDEFDILDADGAILDAAAICGKEGEGAPSETARQSPSDVAAPKVEEDEYADMADFEEEDVGADDAVAVVGTASPSAGNSGEGNIVKVRSYDISITYDKYYQTPRVWLFGYDEDRKILTPEQMFQDVMSDYVKRTVTIESHPHIAGPHISIHPCQHGNVMKNIVGNLSKGGTVPDVESYIFIFLKFVSSIIPTINYDFTMQVTASTSRNK